MFDAVRQHHFVKLWMSGRWTRYLYQVRASLRSYVCIKKYLYKSMNVLSTQHSELDHQASEWTCEGLNKVQTDSPTIKSRWKWNHSTRKWSSQNPISKTQWNFYGLRSCLPVWMLGFFTSTGTLHYTWLADNTNKIESLIASLTFWKRLGDLF